MASDDLLKRVEAFLQNLPNTPFNESSRDFLRQNPLEWATSRNRALRAALLEGDMDAVELIKDDVAHVVGFRSAEWWCLHMMEKMVAQSNDDQGDSAQAIDEDETVL